MLKNRLALMMLFGLGLSATLHAGEPCIRPLCEKSCDSCEDSSCRHDHCGRGKSIGFQIAIPSIRWGISIGCGHSDCGQDSQRCCFLGCSQPPRAPLAFSVPAVTVPQHAMAVRPVLPVQSQAACRPAAYSEMDRLILETLLKRLEAAEARGSQLSQATAQGGLAKSTEQRLTELEHRLDRILEALER